MDLSHNYLRAVTSDLVDGLPSLESLDLTDNDISLVESGALTNLPKLIHLSLTGKSIANLYYILFRRILTSSHPSGRLGVGRRHSSAVIFIGWADVNHKHFK